MSPDIRVGYLRSNPKARPNRMQPDMDQDLTSLLNDWPYEPGQITARIIQGSDGLPKVQVRLDLGILQMNFEGRPDGQRPFEHESLLAYHESRLDHSQGRDAPRESDEGDAPDPLDPSGKGERFSLNPEDCRQLREEAVQYYHRYVALLVLEDFEGVVRDTSRNLRLLDFCAAHAETEGDRSVLEQFRSYITMMRARAMASQAIRDEEPKAAVRVLDEALETLQVYFANRGHPQMYDQSAEVEMLRGMRDALVPKLPVSQLSELQGRLRKAIEQENYELAAILRDELRQLKDDKPAREDKPLKREDKPQA